MNAMRTSLEDLPGGALVARGLEDAIAGRRTAESLLVSVACRWFAAHGLGAGWRTVAAEPELVLYEMLCSSTEVPHPYGRYNSMIRELVSFQRAYSMQRTGMKNQAAERA